MATAECDALEPELIDAALGGPVPAHAAGCARCQRTLASNQALWGTVAALPGVRADPRRRAAVMAVASGSAPEREVWKPNRTPTRDVRSEVMRAAAALPRPWRKRTLVAGLVLAAAAAAAAVSWSGDWAGSRVHPSAPAPAPAPSPHADDRAHVFGAPDPHGETAHPAIPEPAPEVLVEKRVVPVSVPQVPTVATAETDAGASAATNRPNPTVFVAPQSHRLGVLVVPVDKGAEALQVKLEADILEALAGHPDVQTTDTLFGLPVEAEAEAALARAELAFTESRGAFESRDHDRAERLLRANIQQFTKAAGALKSCGHLCDAVAMYAATLHALGEVESSKIAMLDLLALAPAFALDPRQYPLEFVTLRAAVAASRFAQLRGSVTVKTQPRGARVFVDGALAGYSPITLEALPVGKHVIRVERPGFVQWGTVVDVTPEDTGVPGQLTPTAAYKAYDAVLDKLAGEALQEKGGAAMASLARTLSIDRALIGVVRATTDAGGTELTLGLYDLSSGARLASKRATFRGDQNKAGLQRMVQDLMGAPAPRP